MFNLDSNFNSILDTIYIKSNNGKEKITDFTVVTGKELLLNYPEYLLKDFTSLYQYYEHKYPKNVLESFLEPDQFIDYFDNIFLGLIIQTHQNNQKLCNLKTKEEVIFADIKKTKIKKLIRILKVYKLLLEEYTKENNLSEEKATFLKESLILLEQGQAPLILMRNGKTEEILLLDYLKQYGNKHFYVKSHFFLPETSHELINRVHKSYDASISVNNSIYHLYFENETQLEKFKKRYQEAIEQVLDDITKENLKEKIKKVKTL